MTTTTRQEIEQKIISRFVSDALKAGYRLGVSLERGYDVGDGMLVGSRDKAEIVKAAMAGDDAHIFVQPATGELIDDDRVVSEGWVYVVLGNDGWDVISDYTTNLEPIMAGASQLADRYGN